MKLKKLIKGIATIMIVIVSWANPAHAQLVFTNEVFWNDGEAFRIGQDDDASSTDLSLQFGSINGEAMTWDSTNGWFDLTNNLSLEGNQIKNVILDNQSSAVGGVSAGGIYHNITDTNSYIYNGSVWEDITQGTGFTETDSPAVQARRTTAFTLTTQNTWYDIPLDSTDVETDTNVAEHDNTNTDRINIKEDGTYRILYRATGTYSGDRHAIETRVRLNDNTVINGSFLESKNYAGEDAINTAEFVAELSVNNYITLQARGTSASNQNISDRTILAIEKLEGVQGNDTAGDPNITGVMPNTFTLDNDNTGGNVIFQFGTTLAESLTWNSASSRFDLSDDLNINGNLSQYGNLFTLDSDNTGTGADVSIVAEQGTDNNGTLRYNATDNRWEISNDGSAFAQIAASGGTLDEAYDFGGAGSGRSITADSGALEVTVPLGSGNPAFILNQNDTSGNPNTLEINNAGTGYSIFVNSGDGVFDEDVIAGGSTSRTETINNIGFTLNGNDLFVAGNAGTEGNIYADGTYNDGSGLMINDGYIRTTGNIALRANGDTNDYIHLDTTGNEEYVYFEDSTLGYANDPGVRLNSSTGQLEYRDENESAWSALDSLSSSESLDDGYNVGHTVTADTGAVDLNGTGEILRLGNGTANDSYITFDDGTSHALGWDDSQNAFSTFDNQFAFRVLQGTTPPVACSATYGGMEWMDTDTGIIYACDSTRNKWLSMKEKKMFGEQSGTCSAGGETSNDTNCTTEWGAGLGSDATTDLGLFITQPITITAYGFSADNDACTSGSFDIEVISTGSNTDDNNYTWEADVATGLSGEAENGAGISVDLQGNEYIIFGMDNNCGQGIDDFNIIIYFKYRHD